MFSEQESGSELLRLKRRFLKDQEQSRIYFAKRMTRVKQMREVKGTNSFIDHTSISQVAVRICCFHVL